MYMCTCIYMHQQIRIDRFGHSDHTETQIYFKKVYTQGKLYMCTHDICIYICMCSCVRVGAILWGGVGTFITVSYNPKPSPTSDR